MPSLDTNIRTFGNCGIWPKITGAAYFPALQSKIDALGQGGGTGEFIYIAGWWLGRDFSLAGPAPSTPRLRDLLIAKAKAGVDVRVLGWVMAPSVLQNSRAMAAPGIDDILRINADTMSFINALRAEPKLATKACLNILAHPAGAVHMKMALLGSDQSVTGYTGGIDLQDIRHQPFWHDVEAEVTGPIVNGMFEVFKQLWDEIRGRPVVRLMAQSVVADSHTAKMPELPLRLLNSPGPGRMQAQSLITVPQMRFGSVGTVASLGGASIPTNKPASYAPQGLFNVRHAWQRGIQDAKLYIYIEDQGFSSGEVFDMINAALRSNDKLRVVVMAGMVDPTDKMGTMADKFFRVAVNDHLLRSLSSAQIARLGVFSHQTKVMHTKSTIVDDVWAIIGSANCMRRSLYTDFEHAVAYMDDDGQAVGAYRKEMWGIHLQAQEPDPAKALDTWFAIPFAGSAPSPLGITRIHLPMPATKLSEEEQVLYDEIHDVDSRHDWGERIIDFYVKKYGAKLLSP